MCSDKALFMDIEFHKIFMGPEILFFIFQLFKSVKNYFYFAGPRKTGDGIRFDLWAVVD